MGHAQNTNLKTFKSTEQLQSLRPLKFNSGFTKLDKYLELLDFQSSTVEFGAPYGAFSRIIPSLFIKAFDRNTLWISQNTDSDFYPKFFGSLGIKIKSLYFTNELKCSNTIKTAVLENAFNLIVIDTKEFLSKSDLNFLFSNSRKNKSTYLLLRPYYLSNLNGNPFAKFRFNSFFSLKSNEITFKTIKGGPKTNLNFNINELYE